MPTITDVKYGEDNPIDIAPVLTEEEEHTLRARMAAMDKLLVERKRAKYKIELLFSSKYTRMQPYPGALSLWLSGAKLHGGGDTKIYLCPSKRLRLGECEAHIPDTGQGYGFLVCPACKRVWNGSQAVGELLYRLPTSKWALVIYRFFIRLEHNADVYVKRARADIRTAADLEQARQLGGDQLLAARSKKEVVIYPLAHIIKDCLGGTSPLVRFEALLKA